MVNEKQKLKTKIEYILEKKRCFEVDYKKAETRCKEALVLFEEAHYYYKELLEKIQNQPQSDPLSTEQTDKIKLFELFNKSNEAQSFYLKKDNQLYRAKKAYDKICNDYEKLNKKYKNLQKTYKPINEY